MTFIGVPPGVMFQYGGSLAPQGYLICDGSAVSRSTYADLFSAIGTNYGAGDGVSTFNLPDGRGRTLVGQGLHADVGTLGNNEGVSASQRRVRHKHTVNDPGHTHPANGDFLELDGGGPYQVSVSAGGNDSRNHNTVSNTTGITIGPQTGNEPTDSSAYLVVQHIIKY